MVLGPPGSAGVTGRVLVPYRFSLVGVGEGVGRNSKGRGSGFCLRSGPVGAVWGTRMILTARF